MTLPVDLLAKATAWRDQDPDAATRAELDALIAAAQAGDTEPLAERFSSRLEFGTAGLRGELGAGPARMNRVLVSQAAAGFAAYLLAKATSPSVVIGYDGRTNSEVFARDTATIMAGAGVRTTLLPRQLPTPVLAFAVRELGTSGGVMVTASHNPARDNGYKVYLGDLDNGSQIVPPADAQIAAEIELISQRSITDLPRSTDFTIAGEEVLDAYVERTARIAKRPPRHPVVVYTPMHGVGWETAHRVFLRAGFGAPSPVLAQVEPDPAFPTVAFPNPEEPGAMDLAFELAAQLDADLVIANDPDADRLAVGIPTAAGWRRLSGNEVGSLLGWRAARRLEGTDARLAASLVSSPALATIAREHHLEFVETLTGFKWISRVPSLGYGYEEALGYLVDPDKIRDKDGISAAVDFLSLFCELTAEGTTIESHLADFADRFGAFASGQISLRVDDLADIGRMMHRLRTNPPATIGSIAVAQVDDFIDGFGEYPPGDILRLHLVGGARVIVRPSGTEPKLKVYIDASNEDGTATQRQAAAASVVAELDAGMRELLA